MRSWRKWKTASNSDLPSRISASNATAKRLWLWPSCCFWTSKALCGKCSNAECFLFRIFLYSAWIRTRKKLFTNTFHVVRKLPSHLHYHGESFYKRLGWIFSMFELKLSWNCSIFDHRRLNKTLETSDYNLLEAIVRVLV